MSLAAATRSETTKLFTTAMWWILGLVLVVYLAFTVGTLGFVFGASAAGKLPGDVTGSPVPGGHVARLLYSMASSTGYVFPLLIGTLLVTAEFRHHTLTPTFLVTPRRGLALAAKSLTAVMIGVGYAVLALISVVGPAAGLLAAFGQDTQLNEADTWAMLARIVLVFVLWALIGVGVGALVRNQVAAIVIVLVFTQFVEPIGRTVAAMVAGVGDVLQFLPGAAGDALVGDSFYALVSGGGAGSASLDWWAGGLVLLGYAVVLLVLGYVTGWRRDVE